MGLTPDEAAELAEADAPGFSVWPDNMPVIDAFMVVCTQWNTTSLANGQVLYHGLNYTGVKVGLDGADITLLPEQWADLRMVERVASAAMNGRR